MVVQKNKWDREKKSVLLLSLADTLILLAKLVCSQEKPLRFSKFC